MTRPTDPLFDQRIADWLEDDPQHAPGQVLDTVLAALPSIPRRRASRVPWRFTTMPTLTRLAAAAVIGVLVVGGAFYVIQRGQPAVLGGPSQTPSVSAGPSESVSPSAVPSPSIVPARAPSWSATGSMGYQRPVGATATLLPDGKVLVAGGGSMYFIGSSATAELYDPATGSWSATGSMGYEREGATATLLPDGKVLVAGGRGGGGGVAVLASAELYDPGIGSWTATGSMGTPRIGFTATLLPDGKVLAAGGTNDLTTNLNQGASAELYDPSTGTWAPTGSMGSRRDSHTATLLPDGKVLVAGGVDSPNFVASAELYDPGTGTWALAGSMVTRRAYHTATLLPDGSVLVAGGYSGGGLTNIVLATSELYDPGTGSWTATGPMGAPRTGHTATLLPDGKVLVAGGANDLTAELYDPANRSWTATATMGTPRGGHTATLLHDGRVLVAGGSGGTTGDLASTELYDPGSGG